MSYSVQCNMTFQFPSIPIEVESSLYSVVLWFILQMLICFRRCLYYGLGKGMFNV